MKPIVLHIGSTKTGTSSLQRYFSDSSADLLKRGVIYPVAGRRKAGVLAHHNLCYEEQDHRVKNGVFRAETGTWDDALAEIDRSAASTGIISSEAFMNCRPHQVGRFRRRLQGRDVSVMAYVRRQDRWMQSAWNQQARFGRCSLDFWDFYANVRERGRGDYHRMLVPWADAFGTEHLHVRNFDSLSKGGIVVDFFETALPALDVPGASVATGHVNAMAGAAHLVAVATVVQGCTQQLGENFVLAATSAIRIAEFFRSRPGRDARFSVLSYEDAMRVHADFAESNERLAEMSADFARSGGFAQPQRSEYTDYVDVESLGEAALDGDEWRFVQRMIREIVRAQRSSGSSRRVSLRERWRGRR